MRGKYILLNSHNFDEIKSIIDKRNSYNFTFYKFILHIYISKNNYEN